MKRTGIRDIAVALISGVSIGYLLQAVLVSNGLHLLVPPLTFSVTLTVAAVAAVVLALPIRSALTGRRKRPVNALFAARVAVFAKASSLSGALFTGFASGLAYFALTRTVLPGGATIALSVAGVVAGALLLAAGLIAERFCTLPPDDSEPEGTHG